MMLLQKLLKHELNKVWLTVMVDPIYTDDKRRFIFHYFFFRSNVVKTKYRLHPFCVYWYFNVWFKCCWLIIGIYYENNILLEYASFVSQTE